MTEDPYVRGYLISNSKTVNVPEDWIGMEAFGWYIWRSPLLRSVIAQTEHASVLCLGVAFDARDPTRSQADYLNALAASLEVSEQDFLDELSFSGGRYVMLYHLRGEAYLLTDACGMKAAFRCATLRQKAVGSHARLVAMACERTNLRAPLPSKFGYAGYWTPFRSVNLVTPNTKLRMNDFTVERYWPSRYIKPRDVVAASNEVFHLMRNSLLHIGKMATPVVSLTAGLDSRVTLALSLQTPCEYYTYDTSHDTGPIDLAFAKELRENTGLPITILPKRPTPKAFEKRLGQSTYYRHLWGVAYTLTKKYQERNVVHVRSNLSEIGRQFYGKWLGHISPHRGIDLARLWLASSKSEWPSRTFFRVIDAFEEFDASTELTSCPFVDPAILFYWEHRMGSWHSQIIIGTDPAFETLSLYNCRRVLEALISVSTEAQKAAAVHREVIAKANPDLVSLPVNAVPVWPT